MADDTTRLYVITAAAGLLVAGRTHGGVGTTLPLTEAEARYELMLETIVPDGTVVPVPAAPAAVSPIDRLEALRGGRDYDFTVADFLDFLEERALRPLAESIDGRLQARSNLSDLTDPAAALKTLGGLSRTIPRAPRDPTAGEIGRGEFSVWTNTVTGVTSVWANLTGTPSDLLNRGEF